MLDPIRRKKIKKPAQKKLRDMRKINLERQVYIEDTEPKKKGFSWFHFTLILILTIVTSALFWGGLFILELTEAKNAAITKNFSGGAPVLNEPNLPQIGEGETNYDLVNILMLGNGGANHPGGALVDVIQVLSVNVKTKKALMVSIPRDLFIEIDGSKHKINEMYFRGEEKGKGMGGDLSKKIASEVLGIPLHYYLKIDFQGFKKAVDTLDGIDVYVDKGISDPVWGYYISPGVHHFDGGEALDYVRSRYSTSDFDRSARQQKTLVAMKDKALSTDLFSDPNKISSLIETMKNNLRTDITPEELIKIFLVAKDIPFENVTNCVLDTGENNLLYSTITRGGAYVILPTAENYEMMHQFIKERLP